MSSSDTPLVSILFVTYKRFDALKQSLESFLKHTTYSNLELVIADDGSEAAIQEQMRTLPANVFALASKNRGLGANNNNGLSHCAGKYIFMVQDDWQCQGPPEYLANAVAVLEANPSIGLINFAGAPHPPDLSQRLKGSEEPCYVTPKPYVDGHHEYFLYSDQPHIRTRLALEQIGPYLESRDMEACERNYELRWKEQSQFGTAVFPAYHLRAFRNDRMAGSFRTSMFRHRIQRPLVPLAGVLKRHCKPLYLAGKWLLRSSIRTIEKLRLAR